MGVFGPITNQQADVKGKTTRSEERGREVEAENVRYSAH